MAEAGAKPHETLMIGRDERDREAARRAGVAYMPYHIKLCREFELDGHLVHTDWLEVYGTVSFAPKRQGPVLE